MKTLVPLAVIIDELANRLAPERREELECKLYQLRGDVEGEHYLGEDENLSQEDRTECFGHCGQSPSACLENINLQFIVSRNDKDAELLFTAQIILRRYIQENGDQW